MRAVRKWIWRLLAAFVVALIVVGVWKREEISRLIAVNRLFEPERIVENFSNMDQAFLNVQIGDGASPVVPLPQGPRAILPASVADFIEARSVTSLVVLKDGALVHESYHLGTGPDDRRISWSMAKSYLSALTGIVLAEGDIGSLDDRVIDYVPQLRGGAYQRATIRHVLTMTTGVVFDEDYFDKHSDVNRMGRVLALGGEMDAFTAELQETFAPPGDIWRYVSVDTHVLGMVVRGATGRSITALMQEKIIGPMGLEQAPYYLTDGAGVAFVLSGFNGTSRDYARFGQMFLQQGDWNGQQIVPQDWVIASTTPSAPTGAAEYGFGYQWWMPRDARPREYMARGIYGQYLYINEPQGVVIVVTAADRQFRDDAVQQANIAVLREIADSL
ncbi:beta-lactamase family protein [Roseobacter sp. YSTF-M11]|uniref:Beta-lactamase family protein n=1 Tax=Roseobacter insulae TaxID=2859783 RepID=A0A9X1FYZ7_9RHOB|nr:serine hydrolase [Roseobacter insulae]MBW4710319.1 beta-lactamase family protein [Roseobacter insulae]